MTADSAVDAAKQIMELQTRHRNLLWQKKISSPLAVGILEKIFYSPYVSVNDIARDFYISYQPASTLIYQLENVSILKEITGEKETSGIFMLIICKFWRNVRSCKNRE